MSSETSTETAAGDAGTRPWHFFVLLSMAAATGAVVLSPHTEPAALILISAAILACGFVGLALYHAFSGFLTGGPPPSIVPLGERARADLEREKALALRSIKELEFDRAMGKVSEQDFTVLSGRLRARALSLMQTLEQTPAAAPRRVERHDGPAAADPAPASSGAGVAVCAACQTHNEPDARFCKHCGAKL
jgi:hypothetical protein